MILDDFEVSHTKDDIQFMGDEEDRLELHLAEVTKELKRWATVRTTRPKGGSKTPWEMALTRDIAKDLKNEFASPEMNDALKTTLLPPINLIQASNQRRSEAVTDDQVVEVFDIAGIRVRLILQDKAEAEPHLTIYPPSETQLDVIINRLHPYYVETNSEDNRARYDELIRQFIYDAVSEHFVLKKTARQEPDAVRLQKSSVMNARISRMHNQNVESQEQELNKLANVQSQTAPTPPTP